MSANTPLVSIVLPTLNGSRYIRQSIESCLSQTYDQLELVVVDGGSSDGTREIVRSFRDPRIRLVIQPDNSGRLPGALNYGFAQARGALFTWTQDDDYFAPEALTVMAAELQRDPAAGFVYAGFWFIDAQDQVIGPAELGTPDDLCQRNSIGHCFLYRRAVAEAAGAYDPGYLLAEDFEYWLRVARLTRMIHLPGHYFYHRLHNGSLTMRAFGRFAALRVAARARRDARRIGWLAYQRQLADAYIQEAFAAHTSGMPARVRRSVILGSLHNFFWLANRGVWSIFMRSFARPTSPDGTR